MAKYYSSALFLLASALHLAHGDPSVYVPGQKVTYQGSTSAAIEHFQGIPFAKDTAGQRRFAPPEPYVPEEGTLFDASRPGALCPQTEAAFPLLFDETPEMSEDCLNLRIARPAGTSSNSKLPVVVWIHGGGVVKGSAYDSHFDPNKFLRLAVDDGTPVLYTAINYRMTIFGFPRLPILKDQKALNLGIRDQRLALQWIQNNIEAFGGDAERITVYGLSAGGTFAALHTLAYGGEKGVPFQQAWMMSGPAGTALNMTTEATAEHTLNVADRVNCGNDVHSGSDVLTCLRAVPMAELLDAAMSYSRENHPPAGVFTFIPSVDGDFFPNRQSVLIKDGRFVKGINQVYGYAQDDGALNVGDALGIQSEDDIITSLRAFASELSADDISYLLTQYPSKAFEQDLANYEARKSSTDPSISVHFFRVSRMLRDLLFTCPSIDFGYEMFKQTRVQQPEFDSVRLYALNQSVFTPMIAAAGMPYVGTIHGSDTPYIFNSFPEGDFDEADADLARKLSRALISFAYSGNPISANTTREGQLPEWPPAFTVTASSEAEADLPDFNVQVIGGPLGTGPATVMREAESSSEASYKYEAQNVLDSVLEYAGMQSAQEVARAQQLETENLHKRCAYWRTLDESLGR